MKVVGRIGGVRARLLWAAVAVGAAGATPHGPQHSAAPAASPTPKTAKPPAPAAATDGEAEPMGGSALTPPSRDPHVDYAVSLDGQQMWVRKPKTFKADQTYGLLVYLSAENDPAKVPSGWASVLDHDKLIYVGPGGVGTGEPAEHRCGLAVMAALRAQQEFKIDPARVYVAGQSGGARLAGMLGFFQADLFRGTIQSCGADFPGPAAVPQVAPRDPTVAKEADYGHFEATPAEVAAAKAGVRFVLITGSHDPHHGFVVDLFNGGFQKGGFRSKLIDVPGMSEGPATAAKLQDALTFIEAKTGTTATTGPTARSAAAPAASADDAEAAAGRAVDMAQNYISLKDYDEATIKLKAVIATYPKTAAAAKAKKMLATMPAAAPPGGS